MAFHFVRTGSVTEEIGKPHECQIILRLAFNDSDISADPSKNALTDFVGKPKPSESMAITYQSRSLKEITYSANGCFIGRSESFGLRHIYAEQVLQDAKMDEKIDQCGARFKLPIFYKSGFNALAQISPSLFMPVTQPDVVLDKITGTVIFAQNAPVAALA